MGLSAKTVSEIRSLYGAGETIRALNKRFGITNSHAIVQNRQYFDPTYTIPPTLPRSGENNPNAKLRADQVEVIKNRILSGEALASIAQSFSVSRSTIQKIAERRSWVDEL